MVVVVGQQQRFTLLSPDADADADAGSDGDASEVKRTLRTFFVGHATQRDENEKRMRCDAIKLLNKMRANNKQKRGKGRGNGRWGEGGEWHN